MDMKNYKVMGNHCKIWYYLFMREEMQSGRAFWMLLVLQSLNISFVFRSSLFVDSVKEKTELLAPALCIAGGTYSHSLVFLQYRTIFKIISVLQQHYEQHKNNPKDLAIISTYHGEGYRMLKVFSIVIAICAVSFTSRSLVFNLYNYFTGREANILMPFEAAYPWKSEGRFLLASFVMQLGLMWVMPMVVSNVSTSMFFCMAIVAHLKITQERFKEVPEECSEEEGKRLMETAVKTHQEALNLIKLVDGVESPKIFSQVFSTAAALSMCMFRISCAGPGELAVTVPIAVLGGCVVSQLGLVCFYGQKVMNAGEELCEVIYAVPWYNQSKQFKLCLKFCLMRAERPDRLTAWSFADVSSATFNGVMTTAFSYVTFLQTMSE